MNYANRLETTSAEEKVFIKSSHSETHNCRTATFLDYCNLASKTAAEMHTLNVIAKLTSTHSCEIDLMTITDLNLDNKGIESLKPLMFFNRLQNLSAQENRIQNLEGFDKLIELRSIDLDRNPQLGDLNPILHLPQIENIWARETSVTAVDITRASPSLKKVKIDGKARVCEIRYFDSKSNREIIYSCDK